MRKTIYQIAINYDNNETVYLDFTTESLEEAVTACLCNSVNHVFTKREKYVTHTVFKSNNPSIVYYEINKYKQK